MLQVNNDKLKERKAKKEAQRKAREERARKKKEREEKKLDKLTGRERRLMQAAEKIRNERIDKNQEAMFDITLKIMNFSLIKGSPEHLALRAELYRLNDEEKELKTKNWRELLDSETLKKLDETLQAAEEIKKKEREERLKNKDYVAAGSAEDFEATISKNRREPKKRGRKKQNEIMSEQEDEEGYDSTGTEG